MSDSDRRGGSHGRPRTDASRHRVVAALAVAIASAGCGPRPQHGLKGIVPPSTANTATVALPEAHLDGPPAPFALRASEGGLLIVFFGFASCPDVCPTTLSDIRAALRPLGGEMARCEVAFITVDLVRDSAAVLVPYLASFVPRGHALRPASQEQLAVAERAFGANSSVTRWPDGKVDVSHWDVTSVVDEAGRIRVEWPFGTRPADMTHDLRILLAAPSPAAR